MTKTLILQPPSSSLPSFGPSESALALPLFLQHQTQVTMDIGQAEVRLTSARAQLDGLSGTRRALAEKEVNTLAADIRGMQVDLNATRGRIRELRRGQGVVSMETGIGVADDQRTIFMLKPSEFTGALTVLFVFPIVVAISRWIWRRSPARSRESVLEGSPQIARLEQAIESIAIEVERISEAQRFSAKLLAERPVESEAAPPPRPLRSRRPITPLP